MTIKGAWLNEYSLDISGRSDKASPLLHNFNHNLLLDNLVLLFRRRFDLVKTLVETFTLFFFLCVNIAAR